ncbi:zinc-ribbon domain-containing protein [Archangium gephyra]|uniref:zinc-ribbon domain-containing protein n=1 Tax=Archangium gephyra TaxID=48 RepID=UPI0035D4FAB0
MIVKCERCQTRFKIPDEKVTDKGVKVRCTKCQHTFKVAREDSTSAAPAPAMPSPDPAAKPPATPRAGTPLEVPRASPPAAKAPVRPANLDNLFDGPVSAAAAAPGIAAPRGGAPAVLPRVTSLEAPRTPATIDLDPLMEFMGENTPTPAEALKLAAKAPIPNKPAGALATGPAQPPRPAAPAPKPAQAAAPVQVPAKSPAPVQVPAKSPALAPVSSAPFSFDENDPFGSTDTEATLPAPVPTLPPAPKPVPTPVPVRSAPPAPKPAAPAPVPVQVPARSPAPAPRQSAPVSFEENDPFSLPSEAAPTVPATPTLPPRGAAPAPRQSAPSFEENDPFSLPPDDVTTQAAPTLPPRGAAPAPMYEEMEGLEGNNPFVSFEPPAAPAPTPARAAPVPVPAAAPSEMEDLEGNNPFATFDPVAALPPASAQAPAASEMDGGNPFAAFDPVAALPPASAKAPVPAPSPAPSGIPDWGAPQQAAPSGIPDWGAPQQAPPSGVPDWGAPQTVAATPIAKANAPTERNPFPDFPGPGEGAPGREVLADLPPAPPPPVIAAPPPPQSAPAERTGPSLVQRLAGVAAQFMVAAVLVVGLLAMAVAWLNDGRMELSALSPSRMRELVSPTRPLVAKDLSNGLYETRDGHSLFFVRGEVENRGTSAIRVKAGVVLYEGEQRVKSAEGIAGAVPTPEELNALASASEADTLRARLDAAAKEVAPGARAPFVVFFYEYPSDLANFRLEVTLEPQTAVASGGSKEGSNGNAQP